MIPLRDDTPRFSTPYITYFIIALNALVFIFELSVGMPGSHGFDRLMYQMGAVPSHLQAALGGSTHYTLPGFLFNVLTSMFVHGGFLHIIGNMWVLWIFGDNIEDYVGHFPYLLFYLVTGFAAAMTQVLLSVGSNIPIVGASGAIAGVMGAYFILYPRARVLTIVPLIVFFTFWWLPAWIVLGYWILVQFLSGAATSASQAGQSGGVAFWAHVGGFVAGIILIKILPQRRGRYRYAAW